MRKCEQAVLTHSRWRSETEARKTYGTVHTHTQHTAYSASGGKQMNVAAVGTKPALGVITSNVHYWGGSGLGWIVKRMVRPVG